MQAGEVRQNSAGCMPREFREGAGGEMLLEEKSCSHSYSRRKTLHCSQLLSSQITLAWNNEELNSETAYERLMNENN